MASTVADRRYRHLNGSEKWQVTRGGLLARLPAENERQGRDRPLDDCRHPYGTGYEWICPRRVGEAVLVVSGKGRVGVFAVQGISRALARHAEAARSARSPWP